MSVRPSARATPHAVIKIRSLSAARRAGMVELGPLRFACALGRSGSRAIKREGDGATPRGCFGVARVLYKPDAVRRPRTGLRVAPIRINDGWCDDEKDGNYNRPVRYPYVASAERMWRDDGLYDYVVVISHNQRPRIKGRGSAIFMHVAKPGLLPTEGCIALARKDLARLLARLGPRSKISISV
jgi:L,D-peptidoglycan transpeptidase YkuD (ErfK/YbiS/YcfS/YnhG family)